ncbi:hypothetical protein [Gordonia sp. FQ]|uniref:hypothetical protein n=1 Tax=Gordonia sp. FQ TaxID=3446634 RepID=UPI003F86A94F
MFAGVAGDRDTEKQVAAQIDSGPIICWSQDAVVRPGAIRCTEVGRVYIVFDGGGPQNSSIVGWDLVPSPEVIGVFADPGDAHAAAADFIQTSPSQRAGRTFVWNIEIGWYDRRLISGHGRPA